MSYKTKNKFVLFQEPEPEKLYLLLIEINPVMSAN